MNIKSACAVLTLSVILAGTAEAAAFPPAGIDTFPSTGKFSIQIDQTFLGLFPGVTSLLSADGFTYNNLTDTWKTPLLTGPTSVYHGTPYSSAGVLPASITSAGITPTPGGAINTVDTKMLNLTLSAPNITAVAGTSLPGTTILPTYGEVVSLSTNTPAGGFPATSTFDLYVQIALAGLSNAYLYNADPKVISSEIKGFPPISSTVYEAPTNVALYLHDPSVSNSDILFGYWTAADHVVTPIPAAIFFVAPALAGVFGWSRRKNKAITA